MGVVMERLQRALRAVAAGGDPSRMLEETLAGAVVACGAAGGVVVATVGGRPKMLTANGPYAGAGVAMETAEAALANGRLTRRRFRTDSLLAVGQPVRVNGRVAAAIALAGAPADNDTTALPIFADVIALALGQLPCGTLSANLRPSAGDVLVTLAEVASPFEKDGVLVRSLAGCERLFQAVASCCALVDGERVVIAHQRGLDQHRLAAAASDVALAVLLRSSSMQVLSPGAPEVAALGRPQAWTAVMPLV